MKYTIIVLLTALAFAGCATDSYDTFRARATQYDTANITVNPTGLSAEQIKTILSTRFPKKDRVSIALFYLVGPKGGYRGYDSGASVEDELKTCLVRGLAKSANVDRLVPIPPVLVPAALTFDIIQQLGIRSLSEYSLIVYGDAYSASSWQKFAEGKYTFNSKVDFLLVDNETTAIIAADKLISNIDVKIEVFNDIEYTKAKAALFAEQEKAITAKMNALFARTK
jgi:hypothetical protein